MITVRDCLQLPVFSTAIIAAGESGLDRIVDSITIAEVIPEENEEFINNAQSNQLTISAFASIANMPELQVLTVIRSNASNGSGLILFYLGVYLKELSQELLDTANKLNYPIIIIPFESNIAYSDMVYSVMELIIQEKLLENTKIESTHDYVSAVLNDNQIQSNIISKSLGISNNNLLGICIFSNINSLKLDNPVMALSKQFSSKLESLGIKTISSIVDKRVILLMFSENNIKSIYLPLQKKFNKFANLIKDANLIMFFSFNKTDKISIRENYIDFCKAEKYLPVIFPYVSGFDSYAIEFALICTDIIKNQEQFFNENKTYSLLNKLSDDYLMKTLSTYILDSNMNSSITADLLYVHTNTINYRINKIKEILQLNLSDTTEIVSLSLALAVRRILTSNG